MNRNVHSEIEVMLLEITVGLIQNASLDRCLVGPYLAALRLISYVTGTDLKT